MQRKHYVATLSLLVALLSPTAAATLDGSGATVQQTPFTLRSAMRQVEQSHGVSFVYDASLNLRHSYQGASLDGRPLDECLRLLFAATPIGYRQDGRQVLLFLKNQATRRFTLSGYVTEDSGEPLLNATVLDLDSGVGTMTNEHGFFSITLPEGRHRVRFSFVGFGQRVEQVALVANRQLSVSLTPDSHTIENIVIESDMNSPVLTTQTGKKTLTPADLETGFSLFSSPDVIKTLQSLSGVSQGIELASGLYVHGGGGDENLFLLDGTPLYQTNHLLGLFSSFNTDVVKNVDFYKSGFPARYGGRLSSVVDVRTNDGDMEHCHGSYSIGLIDGRFQIEGPIVKNRTSFNIGLRRTWSDLLMRPMMALANHQNPDEQLSLYYFFHDLNLKLTHRLDDRNTVQLSFYSGTDRFDLKATYEDSYSYSVGSDGHTVNDTDTETDKGKYSWGNDIFSADWKHIFSPRLFACLSATYSHNRSMYNYQSDERTYTDDELADVFHNEHSYRSTINDLSLHTDWDYRPLPAHHVRFGGAYSYHLFRPQTRSALAYFGSTTSGEPVDTLRAESSNRQPASELTLYAEDELRLTPRLSVNAGLHADLFGTGSKLFFTVDPRLAAKLQLAHHTSLKASYTWMTQQMHRLQNTFIDLPTDYWVPTTSRVPPMRSHQLSLGLYSQPLRGLTLQAELYYKRSQHLLQYSNWIGLEPPADAWDRLVLLGSGRSRGLDLDISWRTQRAALSAGYTLSWTERRFTDVSDDWYPDKFDNRHKLNLTARLFHRKSEFYAAWTFHTGNRITLPEHYAVLPLLPGGQQPYAYTTNNGQLFYTIPNNAQLPAYHRLDVGWNLRHTTKAGHLRIWNISVYNAYCRMNPLYTEVRQGWDERFEAKAIGFVPILPSVSYTIQF